MSLNREQFSQLIRGQQAMIFRYFRYLGTSKALAEDLTQETFLAALHEDKLSSMNDQQAAGWLRTVAKNKLLNHHRDEKRKPMFYNSEAVEQANDVWEKVFLREGDGFDYAEALRNCIANMEGKQKRAIEMRYQQNASRAEMASELGIKENSVKSLLQRVRQALAGCVEKRLETEASS